METKSKRFIKNTKNKINAKSIECPLVQLYIFKLHNECDFRKCLRVEKNIVGRFVVISFDFTFVMRDPPE